VRRHAGVGPAPGAAAAGRGAPDAPDAVVVGSGPNGLAAALVLAEAGWRVEVWEAATVPGGGLHTIEDPPGFLRDTCASVFPMAGMSPAFRHPDLTAHGLEWCDAPVQLAHPLDGGRAVLLHRSVTATASGLGGDGPRYRRLFEPLLEAADGIAETVLSGLRRPRLQPAVARFGAAALRSARSFLGGFTTDEARALLAGCAAHASRPLSEPGTAGFALFLALLGHRSGWPVVRGGAGRLAEALVAAIEARGGRVHTGRPVGSLRDLRRGRATLLGVGPAQVLRIAADDLPPRYAQALRRYRYGPGICKVDWTLAEPVPWQAPGVAQAATVHLGGTATEIAAAEGAVAAGRHPDRPFVILTQPGAADPGRAPPGRAVAWGYCHTPPGSEHDAGAAIEAQVERFAPGFRDVVLSRRVTTAAAVARQNPCFVGGDIGTGATDLRHLFLRPVPALRPWITPVRGLYLCSAATPPGPGAHGMCGWHAARTVLAQARRGRT